MSTAEKPWVLKYALILMAITTIPYFLGYFYQNDNWRYVGLCIGIEDGNSYIAKMLTGATGSWLFRSPYTSFEQEGIFILFPYLLLGKLASSPGMHEQLVVIFHIFRWVGGIFLVYASYDFISVYISKITYRRLGVIVATAGGGLGWFSILGLGKLWGDNLPLEFYSPESFGFLGIFGIPHMAMGRAFFLWGLRGYLQLKNNQCVTLLFSFRAGVLFLLSGLFQPIFLLISWVVMCTDVGIEVILKYLKNGRVLRSDILPKKIKDIFLIFLISSPLVAYNLIILGTDKYYKIWHLQNLLFSPPIYQYLLTYGWIIPFVVIGILQIRKVTNQNFQMLIGWLIIFPILIYIPLGYQRRLADGIWVVLIIFGLFGFETGVIPRKYLIVYGTSIVSTLVILLGSIMGVQNQNSPIFLPGDQISSFEYLSKIATPGEVVLASYDISNALPAWAPLKVIIGHGVESANLSTIQNQINRLTRSEMNEGEWNNFLEEYNIDYIMLDRKGIGSDGWQPSNLDQANLIYRNSNYEIYRSEVRDDGGWE